MVTRSPRSSEILGIVEAQNETLEEFSKRFVKIEQVVEKQESRNQNSFYAVLLAFIFIVVSVAVEVIVSTKQDNTAEQQINQRVEELGDRVHETQSQVDILRARNPYLK